MRHHTLHSSPVTALCPPETGRLRGIPVPSALTQTPAWWLWSLTFVMAAYVVSSQALTNVPGWSRLAVLFAVLLVSLVAFGRLMDFCRLGPVMWTIVPALFVFYCVLRNLIGPIQERPMDRLFALVSAFLGGAGTAFALQAGARFQVLAYAQLASNLCSMIAGLYGVGIDPTPGATEVRYAGVTGNANELAMQLTLGACLIWLLPRRAGMLASTFAFLAMGYAVATTGSRKALLILPIFLVLVLIQSARLLTGKRALIAAASLAVLTIAATAVAPTAFPALKDITAVRRALEYEDSSFDLRVGMTQEGIRLWQRSPLLGSGFAAFERLSGYGAYAHNNYIELLCNTGLIGAVLFYAIHLYVLVSSWRLSGTHRLAAWVFTLMLMVIDVGLVSYDRKQSIMILMLLMSFTSYPSRHPVQLRGQWGTRRLSPALTAGRVE